MSFLTFLKSSIKKSLKGKHWLNNKLKTAIFWILFSEFLIHSEKRDTTLVLALLLINNNDTLDNKYTPVISGTRGSVPTPKFMNSFEIIQTNIRFNWAKCFKEHERWKIFSSKIFLKNFVYDAYIPTLKKLWNRGFSIEVSIMISLT